MTMATLSDLFTGPTAVFAVPAAVGTTLLVARILLLVFAGIGDHADLGHHHDGSGDGPHGDGAAHALAKFFSISNITAILAGGGWAGLIAYVSFNLPMAAAVPLALLGGAGLGLLNAFVLGAMLKLESEGTVGIHDAIGRTGDVYVTVPAKGEGFGQVRLAINTTQKFFNAVSSDAAVPTGGRVLIISANPDNTVTVQPAP